MTKDEIRKMNTTTLAYLGDAVFEVIVREKIVTEKPGDVGRAHHTAVRYVSASGQAKAAKAMINEGFLTDEEEKIYRQARNHRSMSRPQYPAPKVTLNPDIKNFYDFKTDDIKVENYQHGEQIRNIPVAI